MMWNLLPSERLRCWHEFRNSINKQNFEEAIKQTSHLWSYAPYVNHYLTTDQIDNWPGPWELVYENYYCDLAKCLGIVYTLYLSDHGKTLDIEVQVYQNKKTRKLYNLFQLNQGKYILNLIEGEIVNKEHISNELTLKYRYTASDLKLQEY